MAERASAEDAEYMELNDARKDADCERVEVKGGVSTRLGCCDYFEPEEGAQQFRCGTCQHVKVTRRTPKVPY